MRLVAVSLLLAWGLPPGWTVAAQSARPPAEQVARAFQDRYESVRDFSADFVHTYRGGVLRQTLTERGHLLVKKPGRTRWEYTIPEEKLFVSDGEKSYFYVPLDRQVYVAELSETPTDTAALFLAGTGDLARDFSVRYASAVQGAPDHTVALELLPRAPQVDYDTLVLVVDETSFETRMLVANDAQGGQSTFTFSNLRENQDLDDRLFEFSIPRGVEVIAYGENP